MSKGRVSWERCEKEYVEHCRTGWFVVTNAPQWDRVGRTLPRFHTIGSPATGRSLPSITQGYSL